MATVYPESFPGGIRSGTTLTIDFQRDVTPGPGAIEVMDIATHQVLYLFDRNSPELVFGASWATLRLPEDIPSGTRLRLLLPPDLIMEGLTYSPLGGPQPLFYDIEQQPSAAPLDWQGGDGDDNVHGSAGVDFIDGGAGNDEIYGHADNDVLVGGDGDFDLLSGMDGDDVLQGGAGVDVLYGGNGNDYLDGGSGADHLHGNEGDDVLLGGDGDDILEDVSGNTSEQHGGDGNDTLHSSVSGSSQLDGGGGNDFITLHRGGGSIDGGDGNDWIGVYRLGRVSHFTDVAISGGDGDDQFVLDSDAPITVSGGGGVDLYRIDTASAQVTIVDFAAGEGGDVIPLVLPNGYNGGNPFGASGVLRLVQEDADTLLYYQAQGSTGPAVALVRFAGLQANALSAANFFDGSVSPDGSPQGATWIGTDGNDYHYAGLANDHLFGGAGRDQLNGSAGDDVVDGGAGNDNLSGGTGNDVLEGGDGNDVLMDHQGDDVLNGGDGNDLLLGLWGADRIDGGNGSDTVLLYTNDPDRQYQFHAGEGGIVVESSQGETYLLSNVERLILTDGEQSRVGYAFDVDGVAGDIYRVFRAAFGTVDEKSLGVALLNSDYGQTIGDLAHQVAASAAFGAKYGTASSGADLVSALYWSALHRTPDADGMAYWSQLLDKKVITAGDFLASLATSAEYHAATADLIGASLTFTPSGLYT